MYENAKATDMLQGVAELSQHTLRCLAEVIDAGIRMTFGKWTFCPMMTVAYASRGGTGQCDVAGTKAKLDPFYAYEPDALLGALTTASEVTGALFTREEVNAALDVDDDNFDEEGVAKHFLSEDPASAIENFIAVWDNEATKSSVAVGGDGHAKFGIASETAHIALREAIAAVLAGHTQRSGGPWESGAISVDNGYEYTV